MTFGRIGDFPRPRARRLPSLTATSDVSSAMTDYYHDGSREFTVMLIEKSPQIAL